MVRFDSFDKIDFNLIKTKLQRAQQVRQNKKQPFYLDISSSFDTETTSTYINDGLEKFAFMYVWQFGLDGYYCYGRTWEDFVSFCKKLQEFGGLNSKKRLIIYIHNFAFEFQFLRKYFDWSSVFATDKRNPIKALTTLGIEFRDSLILSGYSLEKVGENLTKHNIPKMVGDLDYSKIRTKDTTFTKKELGYMLNDVRVLVAYIDEQREQYKNISLIPLTNTGRVRMLARENCFQDGTEGDRYKKLMKSLQLNNGKEYQELKQVFAGGFTHANPHHVGKVFHNVGSIDFTSSYPTVMISEKYPMSKGFPQVWSGWDRFNEINEKALQIFKAEFTGLKTKVFYDNYLSKSKAVDFENVTENNGRVFSADKFTIYLTSIDWEIVKRCYTWNSVIISEQIAYYKDYLPTPLIKTILELYKTKTELKEVDGKQAEYMHAKGMLNSVY